MNPIIELNRIADREVLRAIRCGCTLSKTDLAKRLRRKGYCKNTVIAAIDRLLVRRWIKKDEDYPGEFIPTEVGYRLDNKYTYGE